VPFGALRAATAVNPSCGVHLVAAESLAGAIAASSAQAAVSLAHKLMFAVRRSFGEKSGRRKHQRDPAPKGLP
jgi:hypothetical protein